MLASIIMAGGSGTRLWPASRAAAPKQYLVFGGAHSYLQQALLRARTVDSDVIVVVAAADQIDAVVAQIAALGGDAALAAPVYVIGEPAQRDTAPAVALGARFVGRLAHDPSGQVSLLVLSADHAIEPPDAFATDVRAARSLAAHGWLTTFGIPPTRPETGYGYLELGPPLGPGFEVAAFREKPDLATARRFLQAGNFLWNAGIFLFPLTLLREELERHAPDVARPMATAPLPDPEPVHPGISVVRPDPELNATYAELTAISIDYALMERSRRVATVRAGFAWSDAGSWDEVAALHPGDAPAVAVEAQGNSVFSDLPVVLAGVNDLIVVVKHGTVLVLGKGRSQLVRSAVDELRDRRPDLL